MTDQIFLVENLEKFLFALERGEFVDQEKQAFEELNLVCTQYGEAKNFLLEKYLSQLYWRNNLGQQHLHYLFLSTQKYSLPEFARILAIAFTDIYAIETDEEILHNTLQIILNYRLFDSVTILNDGQNLRFQGNKSSFSVETNAIVYEYRLQLLKSLLQKYSRILVDYSPPSSQEIQPVIQRLNSVIYLLGQVDQNELKRQTSLLPFTIASQISFSSKLASKLFGSEVNAIKYDELLFDNYGIPLFPILNEDKLKFDGIKIQFSNEGLGCLSPVTVRVVVGEKDFELGESSRAILPGDEHELYVTEREIFAQFLHSESPNIDIKVIFGFKKFNKFYEYSVLADPVGNWLSKLPSLERDVVLPHEISLNNLSPKEFERLCYWIVEEVVTGDGTRRFDQVLWLSEDGGGEQGRDVLAVEKSSGKNFVFQCKRVDKFPPSAIRKELNQFSIYVVQSPDIKPDVYVLFVSSAITPDVKNEGDRLAQQIGMEIEYWPKSRIDKLVRTNDSVRKRFWKVINESS